jgi:uncharacterized caspase-like protein
MFCATTARQKAAEDGEHGVFTRFLLEALQGKADKSMKGFTTFHELVSYVTENVRPYCLQKGYLNQEPTYKFDGMGNLIVIRHDQMDLGIGE